MPCHQRFVIIRPQVVHVFSDEETVDGIADLSQRRHLAIRENVFLDPWIGGIASLVLADGVKQEDAVRSEAFACGPHESPVVLVPDVLEHADTRDAVETPAQAAVIDKADVNRQIAVLLLDKRGLLL